GFKEVVWGCRSSKGSFTHLTPSYRLKAAPVMVVHSRSHFPLRSPQACRHHISKTPFVQATYNIRKASDHSLNPHNESAVARYAGSWSTRSSDYAYCRPQHSPKR